MRVKVSAFGNLRHYMPEGAEVTELELTDGTTVDDLVRLRQIPAGEFWFATVNGSKADGERTLLDGDTVTLFSPVGGG